MPRVLVLLLLVLGASPVQAQTDPRHEAKRYFEAGDQAYGAGQYELAIRAYEEAYQRLPLPAITFSIAQAHRLAYYQDREVEKLRKALELYRRYLVDAPTGNRRVHATQHIEAIEKMLTAMGPAAPPSTEAEPSSEAPKPQAPQPATLLMVASATPGARAQIDGGDKTEVPFATAVSPGRHHVRVEAPGYFPGGSQWLAVEGRLVVAPIDLEARPARILVHAPAGADVHVDGRWQGVAPLSAPLTTEPGQHVISVSQGGHRTSTRIVELRRGHTADVGVDTLLATDQRKASYWVLGGAAALAAAGATITVLAVISEDRVQSYDERRADREQLTEDDRLEREESLEARDDFRTASYVLFGSAVAAGATGALLFLLDTPNVDSRPVARPAGRLRVAIGQSTAGAVWSWSY